MSDEADDIGADIRAALEGAAPEPVTAEPAPVVTAEAEPAPEETASEKAERIRDEQGRFAKATEPVQDAQATAQEPAKTILPPTSWTPAAKAKFATLDPDVQQEILRQDKDVQNAKVGWETKAQSFNKWEAALAPVKDRLALAGLTPEAYISALVTADNMLRGPQAAQALLSLAQQYGIQPAQLQQMLGGGGQQAQPGQQIPAQPDPQIQTLFQTVQSLQARLDAQTKAAEEQSLAEAQATIEAFRQDPAHMYFDNVREDVAALLKSGRATDLKDAYDKACWADPQIRAILMAQGQPKPIQAPTKPAGPSVTGAPTMGGKLNGRASNGSVDDDVRAAWEEHAGRV